MQNQAPLPQNNESDSDESIDSSSISEDSEDQKLQPYKSQNPKDNYDKSDWIKLCYRNEVKRLYRPPNTFENFLDTIKLRYPNIVGTLAQNENAQIYLSYCDSDDDEIEVEDTRELIEAYRYGELKRKKHVLKFNVNVFSKLQEDEDILRNRAKYISMSNFLNTSQSSEEAYIPKYDVEEEEKEVKVEIRPKQQQQKKNEEKKGIPKVQRQPLEDDNDFSKQLYYSNLEGKPIFEQHQQNEQQVPYQFSKAAQHLGLNINQSAISSNPQSSQKQYQPDHDPVRSEQTEVLIGVNLVECKDPNYLRNQEQVKQHKSIWSKVVGFIKSTGPEVPETRKDQARILSNHQSITSGIPPTDVRLQWVIQNRTSVPWEGSSILRNLNDKEVIVKPVRIAKVLQPGQIIEVRIDVFLPKGIQTDKIILMFQFENEKRRKFGEVMIGIIDVQYPGKEQSMIQDSSYQHFDPALLNEQNPNFEEMLYNKASILSDSGFGDFELCYNILKTCQGNEIQAKKELSNMIFKLAKRR